MCVEWEESGGGVGEVSCFRGFGVRFWGKRHPQQ